MAARRALAAVGTALATWISIELLLLAAERASGRVAALLHGTSRALPDERLGSRPNPALPDHDAAGWRNAARPAQAFAVAIGDSQTYGDEVARDEAWPQRLAALTGRSIYSMALGGYGPVEYERLMPEALALSPQLVLVGLYAGNDFADAYLSAYPRALAPDLRSEDAAVVARCEALERRGALKDAWERTQDAVKARRFPHLSRWLEPMGEHSRLVALFGAAARALFASERQPTSDRVDFDTLRTRAEAVGSDWLLPFARGDLSTVFTPAARLALVDTSDARIEEGVRIALLEIRRMSGQCAGRCRVGVVAIPTKERVFAAFLYASGAALPRAFAELTLRENLLWERVRRALESDRIPLVDPLPRLREELAAGRNPYLGDWNGHPDAAGNEAIAEAVRASGLLDAREGAG
ncbi:MAG TPA: hypothetical protein VMS55_01520 [Myxococcota bacterium]|nr:hypothetical protein [Myxococcota bacterium]